MERRPVLRNGLRNQKCFCKSGKKLKNCCLPGGLTNYHNQFQKWHKNEGHKRYATAF